MKYFKLNNNYKTGVSLTLHTRHENGRKRALVKRFEPGVIYAMADLAEKYLAIEQIIREKVEIKRFTPEIEQGLIATNTPYEIFRCTACSANIRKIKVHMFIETDGAVDG